MDSPRRGVARFESFVHHPFVSENRGVYGRRNNVFKGDGV